MALERRNYFEILGLEFDPPERSPRKIEQAVGDWKKRTQEMLANESDSARRAALSEELALHAQMTAALSDGKSRAAEARALKERRVAELERLLDILLTGRTGTPEVTNAQIRGVRAKLGLSVGTIEETYRKKGFAVRPRGSGADLKEAFLSPVVAESVSGKLACLRTMTNPGFSWAPKVSDLFDLACYFSGGSERDAAAFRRRRTAELRGVMESGSAQYASDMSEQGHLMADLFTAGATQVFDCEESRRRYEQTLEREKLSGLFAQIKSAPEVFKRDPYFAESCLQMIQKSFPDYDLALALYNHEAGLQLDPYEPAEALIHVTCASCRTPAAFRTREEAERGQCSVCGAPLYLVCPRCGKKVPASAIRCACGFSIGELPFFEEYCEAARSALREMNLPEARRQLSGAENAHPGHPKLAALRRELEAAEEKYRRPLRELQAQIGAGRLYTAQKTIASLAAALPQLNLEAQSRLVREGLAGAKRRMPSAGLSPREKGNRCAEILETVSDYPPALALLAQCRPSAPRSLCAAFSAGEPPVCTLTWSAAGDRGVTYCVARAKNGVPRRSTEGELLASGLTALEYRDKTVEPGVRYGYAVFAQRAGVTSDPAVCEAERLSELDPAYVRASAEDGACRFSWVLPKNCAGVRILRRCGAIPGDRPSAECTLLTESVQANFIDSSAVNGTTYGYRLQCAYPGAGGLRFSEGRTFLLRPERPPAALRNLAVTAEGRTVTVRWTPSGEGDAVLVRESASPPGASCSGRLVSASELNAVLGGRTLAQAKSSAGQCRFEIPPDSAISLAVAVLSGSRAMVCGFFRAASVGRLELSRTGTRMEGARLQITLRRLPARLERIHYLVSGPAGRRWAGADDARRGALPSVAVGEYKRDGMILVENPPKGELCLSVIGQYRMPDGSAVFSDAAKLQVSNRPKEKISYSLSWESGLFSARARSKRCRLCVSCEAARTPVLRLAYRTDGHIPMQLSDPRTVVLHTIRESDRGFPAGTYVHVIPDSVWKQLRPGTELRLMLSEEDMAAYELVPGSLSQLRVP